MKPKDFEKHSHDIQIEANAFVDKGEGRVEFPKGLVITDNTQQRNGTKYDIPSMDISEYTGKLTADHSWSIQEMIGKTFDFVKGKSKVTIGGIQFAIKQNALAQYAYDMFKAGFLTDFSIETYGPWPDEDGVYHDAKLVGLSLVVTGNNRSAQVNEVSQIATNSIKEAKSNGLDVTELEKNLACYDIEQIDIDKNSNKEEIEMSFKTIKNHKSFAVVLKYKNAAGDEVETTVLPGQSVDVSEDQESTVRDQVDSSTEPTTDEESDKKNDVVTAVSSLTQQIAELKNQMFDKGAQEPEFKPAKQATKSDVAKLSSSERLLLQVNSFYEKEKVADRIAVNEYHFSQLKEKGLVTNTMTISDMGNFVISPEQLTEIQGFRSDFSGFLGLTTWRDTLSTQMAWLERSGDIDMQSTEFCDDGADGNLKPISEYGATMRTANLEELAAVTPVCTAATRFLAADILGDLAAGYRTDYDRKRAQLVIARLQQAVNATGNVVPYTKTSDTTAAKSWINLFAVMSQEIPNGTFIFNYKTYGELASTFFGSANGSDIGWGVMNSGQTGMIFGRPYVVVPNELLPDLNSVGTKTFVVDGANVTINRAVFYADLSKFTGRTSGGLRYDLSTEAAYEDNGTVKSAWQRDELVARGYFYRGGAMLDNDRVVAMGAAGVS